MNQRLLPRPSSRIRDLPLVGHTTPARLLRLGAVLVLGALLTAVVSLVSGLTRQNAADQGSGRVSALSVDSSAIYRALADADAMATSGYVAGGQHAGEPAAVRTRYEADLARAADRLTDAAGHLDSGDPAQRLVSAVVAQLPVYSGLVETARFYNRAGLPLGQSYLGSASTLMRETMLPDVQRLGARQSGSLAADYGRAGAPAVAVLLIGAATLAGLVDAAIRERRRTNRVVNRGLVTAAGLLALVLVWWLAATAVSEVRLVQAGRHGRAATALDEAQVAVLRARSNESLVLVARSGTGASDTGFVGALDQVLGPGGVTGTDRRAAPGPDRTGGASTAERPADPGKPGTGVGGTSGEAGRPGTDVGGNPAEAGSAGGLLGVASAAAGSDGAAGLAAVRADARRWVQAHQRLRALDDQGQYTEAVASAIGTDPAGSGAAFDPLDASLGQALDAQRAAQADAADAARDALTWLPAGPSVLALLAASAAAAGIAARVAEYR